MNDEVMTPYLLSRGGVKEHGTKVLSHATLRAVVERFRRIHPERVESGSVGWRGWRVESKREIGEEGGRLYRGKGGDAIGKSSCVLVGGEDTA